MSETEKSYTVPSGIAKSALIDNLKYEEMYKQSLNNPEEFWGSQAKRLDWFEPWKQVKKTSFEKPVSIEWFSGGKLNVSYNCIDRHLPQKSNDTAFFWEPDDPQQASLKITYGQLHEKVCRLANALKARGIKKGDRVTIYMPMIPEATYAMLACARIGAIHSVVFGGFSPDALAGRITDCDSNCIITADEGRRSGKLIPLKDNVDAAVAKTSSVETVFVVKHTGGSVSWDDKVDVWYSDATQKAEAFCEPEPMDAEDPLFVLYTSGSTGKPKGVVHTTGGYLVYASMTHEYVFDHKPGDVYWCTADVGWVTGHSYIVYGPLANGATSVLFEGVPTYPDCSRHWQIVDKYKVTIYYTAPTAIRALMCQGTGPLQSTSRESLRILGTVGEPINPEAWEWYYNEVGQKRCPIVDTWWQTETGGILITPLPGATALKPGSASKPFFGIQPELVDDKGQVLEGEAQGNLCITTSWPGQMRTVYKDHARFEQTYFSTYPGKYFTGDGCRRDSDGYFWITGRVDDVLNVSGHRLGTAEIESALGSHPAVAESAVVGFPHDIKGQGIYAYVTINSDQVGTDALKKDLVQWVRKEIGPIASIDQIQWAPALPKTRSGKIMRRILRKVAENDYDNLGDVSTLAAPQVVEQLVENRV